MDLDEFLKTLEGLDKEYHQFYEKKDDGYHLKLRVKSGKKDDDTAELRKKQAEFRDNNIRLQRELDDAKRRLQLFDGVDPEEAAKAKKLLAGLQEEEERALIKEGKIDEVVRRRMAAAQAESDKQTKALAKARDEAVARETDLRSKYGALRIDTEVAGALGKAGKLRPTAQTDALLRARSVFTLDQEDNLVPNAGGTVRYNKKGEPMTVEDFATSLFEEAPHLFEAPAGGGAPGAGGKGGAPAKNAEGKIVLRNPDPMTMGRHASDIAAGRAIVVREA